MSKTVKTRKQFARAICAIHKQTVKQTVEGIIRIGRTLIRAKDKLDHGEFTKMIEADLPFDASTAQRLMKIANDTRLRKAAQCSLLPASWGTLYELTKLSDAEFEQAMASGQITPTTTRAVVSNVRSWTQRTPVYYTPGPSRPLIDPAHAQALIEVANRTVVPDAPQTPQQEADNFVVPDPPPPTWHPVYVTTAGATLLRIEHLVRELENEVGNEDGTVDHAFRQRARKVGARLLALAAPRLKTVTR